MIIFKETFYQEHLNEMISSVKKHSGIIIPGENGIEKSIGIFFNSDREEDLFIEDIRNLK